jgi:hypothetical protein
VIMEMSCIHGFIPDNCHGTKSKYLSVLMRTSLP